MLGSGQLCNGGPHSTDGGYQPHGADGPLGKRYGGHLHDNVMTPSSVSALLNWRLLVNEPRGHAVSLLGLCELPM